MITHHAVPEQGDDEDLVDWINRVNTTLADNPPDPPPGLHLIPCGRTPRHHPTYAVADGVTDEYATCADCAYTDLYAAHAGCEHRGHHRWQSWRITHRAASNLYAAGIITGYGIRYSADCPGCVVPGRHPFRGRRPYIAFISRNTWRCLLVGHHRRADPIGLGMCSKCLPCPSCGSRTAGHNPGCPDA